MSTQGRVDEAGFSALAGPGAAARKGGGGCFLRFDKEDLRCSIRRLADVEILTETGRSLERPLREAGAQDKVQVEAHVVELTLEACELEPRHP